MSREQFHEVPFNDQPDYGFGAPASLAKASGEFSDVSFDVNNPFGDSGYDDFAPTGNIYQSQTATAPKSKRGRLLAVGLTIAAAAGITGYTMQGSSEELPRATTAAAPAEAPVDVAKPINTDAYWQGGRTVLHFVDIKGTKPVSQEVRTDSRNNVQAGLTSLRTMSGGQYPDMPVVMGGTLDLRNKNMYGGTDGITAKEVCNPNKLSLLHLLAQREISVTAPNEDMNVVVFNLPQESTCKEDAPKSAKPATAQAYNEQFIMVNSAEALASSYGAGVMEHEWTHIGDEPGHDYGHDSALNECGPETGTIDVEACTDADEYGNVMTTSGYGFVRDGVDPDPYTGFQANYLGILPDAQIATVKDDTEVNLQALSNNTDGTKVVRIPVKGVTIAANQNVGLSVEKPTALHIELSQGSMRSDMKFGTEVKAYLVDEKREHPSTYSVPLEGLTSKYGLGASDVASTRTIQLGDQNVTLRLNQLTDAAQPGQGTANVHVDISGN